MTSSPGAPPRWQPPDMNAAVRNYLLLHHYLRLRHNMHAHREARRITAAVPVQRGCVTR